MSGQPLRPLPAHPLARIPPRSRLGRIHASHSYGIVLALTVSVFLFTAVAPERAWAGSVLVLMIGATLVAALWTSGVARTDSTASLVVAAVVGLAAMVNLAPGGRVATGAVGLLTSLATGLAVAVIALGVVDQGTVNRNSIRGAIAIYVLLGMLFVFLYGAAAILGRGPFFLQGTDGTRSIRLYFSYVTLATLGYGDYTPADAIGRTLAIVEALTGQLYLVTIVALLVSRLGFDRGPGREPPSLIPPG